MRKSIEVTGSTLEEAKQSAMEQLGATDESQVEFEILDEGKRGLLGLGQTAPKVRATMIEEAEASSLEETAAAPTAAVTAEYEEAPFVLTEEIAQQTVRYIQTLLDRSPMRVQVVLRGTHSRYCEVELVGRDVPYLVGKTGDVIDSLQYLLNMVIAKQVHPQVRVVIDAGGYRRRRGEKLRNQAMVIALEVKKRGEEAVLPPMPAHERRVIHQALKEDPDVETYSEGDEPNRRVVISPKKH